METGPWEQYQSNSTTSGPWENFQNNEPGKTAASAAKNLDFERGPNYPTAAMTDATPGDVGLVAGLPGLIKGGAALAARGVGAALEAAPLTENIVPAVKDLSDDMLLKGMGTRAGQIKQLGGLEAARDAADVGRQAGAADVFSTERGRLAGLRDLIAKQGSKIGDLRAEAGPASSDLLDSVKSELGGKYNPAKADVFSGEAPNIDKGLNTIKNAAGEEVPTNAGIAKGVSALNRYNVGAAPLQPVNALTDVANATARANDAEIAQKLGADKAAQYLAALKNESGAFHLQPVLEKGMAREAVARGGGKGIIQSLIQKAADSGGYRASSKTFNALYDALHNPVTSLPSTSAGLVSPEIAQWIKEHTKE